MNQSRVLETGVLIVWRSLWRHFVAIARGAILIAPSHVQLVEIIKVVGTPTREEIQAMNQNYTEFKFPQIKAHPWSKVRQAYTLHPIP